MFERNVPSFLMTLPIRIKGKMQLIFGDTKMGGYVIELLGEMGTVLVLKAIGAEETGFVVGKTGFDSVMYHKKTDRFMLVQAKGNTARLSKKTSQMRDSWITPRLQKIIQENDDTKMGQKRKEHFNGTRGLLPPHGMWALVVKTAFNKNKDKFEFNAKLQTYGGIEAWGSPF